MKDKFGGATSFEGPPTEAFPVTPNDGEDLETPVRAVNVSVAGTLRVTMVTQDPGAHVTLTVSAGTVFPIRAKRIWATGTTATGIVGLV